VEALVGLAFYHGNDLRTFASTNRNEQLTETTITKALTLAPGNGLAHFVHANILHVSGATERSLLQLDPNFTVARFRNERRSDNPTFLGQRERIYEGLSLAGVPEEAP
jgi:hypothetical protein